MKTVSQNEYIQAFTKRKLGEVENRIENGETHPLLYPGFT
jgi:hypothetical protein